MWAGGGLQAPLFALRRPQSEAIALIPSGLKSGQRLGDQAGVRHAEVARAVCPTAAIVTLTHPDDLSIGPGGGRRAGSTAQAWIRSTMARHDQH